LQGLTRGHNVWGVALRFMRRELSKRSPELRGALFMKKPTARQHIPPRSSDNVKRELHPEPDPALLQRLCTTARYVGIAKHEESPRRFELAPYTTRRGDETRCDKHAGFVPEQMESIPRLLCRGIRADLIAKSLDFPPPIARCIGDDGWIFEARITNAGQAEYHGYPVRSSEAIAKDVFQRYVAWTAAYGDPQDREAALRCQAFYSFKQ
jgi:hypothetical protein